MATADNITTKIEDLANQATTKLKKFKKKVEKAFGETKGKTTAAKKKVVKKVAATKVAAKFSPRLPMARICPAHRQLSRGAIASAAADRHVPIHYDEDGWCNVPDFASMVTRVDTSPESVHEQSR